MRIYGDNKSNQSSRHTDLTFNEAGTGASHSNSRSPSRILISNSNSKFSNLKVKHRININKV